jgi:hypothetical protein
MFRLRFTILAAGAAAALAAIPASATEITFHNITGTWFDAQSQGGPALGYFGNGTGNARVRWGQAQLFGGRSGYNFQAAAAPTLSVTPPSGSDATVIGTFTHVNQPIAANTSITGISLKFNTDVFVDGNYLTNVNFFYDFNHLETPNQGLFCANGGLNHLGVNSNGCADRVSVNFNTQSEGFQIGNSIYALDIVGFLDGNNQVSQFWTREDANNSAQILGRVALYSEIAPGVPEPATWAMMIAGFGLVGIAARRRSGERRLAA